MSTSKEKEEKRLLSAEDLFHLKQIGEPTFRSNTNEVYYTISQANKEDNGYRKAIWRFHEEPKQFTQGLPSDGLIKWSPDGQTLAFISIRGILKPPKPGDPPSPPPKPQIYLIPLDGGEALQLTTVENGVTDFDWSKDGKKIAFICRLNKEELAAPSSEELKNVDPEGAALLKMRKKKEEQAKEDPRVIERLIYRAGTTYRDDRKGQVHVIDLETKKVDRWTDSTEDDFGTAVLAPDNSYVLSARKKPDEGDETRNWEILKITPEGEITVIAEHFSWGAALEVSPDGKYIATNLDDEEKGMLGISKLVVYNVEDGSRRILAEEIDADKLLLKWTEDGKYLYFHIMEKGVCGIWRVAVNEDKVEQVVSGDRVIIGYDISKDGEWLTYQAYHVSDPSKLYRYHIPTKKEVLLHAPNEKFLQKIKLGKTEEIWYDGFENDFKIQGWILTPADFDPEKKYPLALDMHGGPHVMWSCHQSIPMFHEFQLLAAEGYVVFYCNPRGSGGYGGEFKATIEKSWGEKDSKDILKGVDLVVEKGFIDKKRMGVTGGSYAGFLTGWIVGHDDRFAAAVSQRGVYAVSLLWGMSDAGILIEDEFGGGELDAHELLWQQSPVTYAKNVKTPLIILHSDLDFRAPIPDAEMFYAAIKRANPDLDLQLVRYPREGHELSRSGEPNHRIDRLKRIVDWFDKYCQPKKIKEKKKQEEAIKKAKERMQKKLREQISEIKKKGR